MKTLKISGPKGMTEPHNPKVAPPDPTWWQFIITCFAVPLMAVVFVVAITFLLLWDLWKVKIKPIKKPNYESSEARLHPVP